MTGDAVSPEARTGTPPCPYGAERPALDEA
jgi:hypothetical protein